MQLELLFTYKVRVFKRNNDLFLIEALNTITLELYSSKVTFYEKEFLAEFLVKTIAITAYLIRER